MMPHRQRSERSKRLKALGFELGERVERHEIDHAEALRLLARALAESHARGLELAQARGPVALRVRSWLTQASREAWERRSQP
jgi:hypothetical protein